MIESEKSQLLDLAENSTGDARSGARSILSFVYGNEYCDCITPIEGGNKSSYSSYVYSQDDMAHAMGLNINVKPNPSTVYSSIDYTLPIGIEKANLQLINAEGKFIYTESVKGVQGQITLNVSNYPAGAYIINIQAGEYKLSKSFIIH